MALVPDIANETARHQPGRGALQSSVAKLRESIAIRARALPRARHAWARYRRRRYEQRIRRFVIQQVRWIDDVQLVPAFERLLVQHAEELANLSDLNERRILFD